MAWIYVYCTGVVGSSAIWNPIACHAATTQNIYICIDCINMFSISLKGSSSPMFPTMRTCESAEAERVGDVDPWGRWSLQVMEMVKSTQSKDFVNEWNEGAIRQELERGLELPPIRQHCWLLIQTCAKNSTDCPLIRLIAQLNTYTISVHTHKKEPSLLYRCLCILMWCVQLSVVFASFRLQFPRLVLVLGVWASLLHSFEQTWTTMMRLDAAIVPRY